VITTGDQIVALVVFGVVVFAAAFSAEHVGEPVVRAVPATPAQL